MDDSEWLAIAEIAALKARYFRCMDEKDWAGREAVVHHGRMPEIEVTSSTAAIGVWAMENSLWARDTAPVPFRTLRGFGHYHETCEKRDGGWAIKTTA